ncbi:MAG: DNA-3-methyladenine glycosylase [Proteobacteria bacterium]|nr:DNA-3-methyladenine glycosylase [Pseudomonadota bacterium]
MSRPRRLRRREFPSDTVTLARYLLGKLIVRRIGRSTALARIVETESYVQGDAACHAFRGPTQRNRSLYLRPGHAYVYLCYGSCWLLNVSSEAAGTGSGVLLRAAEPLRGLSLMQARREHLRPRDLCKGPGRLTQALRVDRRFDGIDLLSGRELWLAQDGVVVDDIGVSTRIGINRAVELPLRFYVRGNPCVSGPRRLNR